MVDVIKTLTQPPLFFAGTKYTVLRYIFIHYQGHIYHIGPNLSNKE